MAKVIIGILTYNLENYIAVAIESVLQQKTNFEYKLLIADDCSTDNTVKILKEYKEKYPNKIELILSKINGGSLVNAIRIYERIDSEYFAILDGDDIWVGEDRLQKQVDFLENHPRYSICAGQTHFLIGDEIGTKIIPDQFINRDYTFEDFFTKPVLFHISGILYRNVIFKNYVPNFFYDTVKTFENCACRGEDMIRLIHLEEGPLYALSEVVSLYRIHNRGIWTGSSNIKKALESAISANFYKKFYRKKYPKILYSMEDLFNQSYIELWKILVNNNYVVPTYRLSNVEDYLLRSLLEDLSKDNDLCNKIVF